MEAGAALTQENIEAGAALTQENTDVWRLQLTYL
jgi:hypothetical protein